jgi:C-8 sterol isomerase
MSFVFEPAALAETARRYLGLPREEMFRLIAAELAERYPGRIELKREWVFNNAGGAMGMMTILYASVSEYVIFFGSPIGTEGHTGRYRFTDDYAWLLDGEMWHYGEAQTERREYRPGDEIRLCRGEAKGYRIPDHAWILEYARGAIPLMLPFGFADAIFSTLDYRTLFRTMRLYGKQVLRNIHSHKGNGTA